MSHDAFSVYLLLDIALKILLLMALTAVGAWLLRKRSAATIHRWWVLGFFGCLAVPAIALIAPAWSLPILPTSSPSLASNLAISSPRGDNRASLNASNRLPDVPIPRAMPDVEADLQTPPTQSLSTVSYPPQTNKSPGTRFSWTVAVGVLWLVGTLACVVRAAWQQMLLVRLLRRSREIDDQKWRHVLTEASNSLGLGRKIVLLMLPEAQSPLTAGLVRSVVILPGYAESWDPARRRLVLLHELAHVKRHDVLTQTLAGLACSMYWFNPLCWYGLVQMRKLRELACDDLVLCCDQQPTDYADVLLEVARTYRHHSFPTAVGIVHSTNVEKRILSILDKARSHVALSRRAARVLLASATALALLIGSMRLESQAEPPSTAESAETTPEKALVELPVSDNNTRTMVLYIRDENDVPVSNANVKVRIRQVYMGQDNFTKFQSDELGLLKIAVPDPIPYLFSATVSEPGYVPFLAEWMSHDAIDPIPAEYTMYLDAGRKIGGVVRDEKGEPIEGAQVSPWFNITQRPERMNQLGWGQSVKTNAEGEWTFASLPTDLQQVTLTFKHPDFVELRITEPVATLAVQAGGQPSTVTTMRPGIVFGGRVTRPDGTPLKGAKVMYFKQNRFSSDSPTTTTDNEGRYRFYSGEEGRADLIVTKSGFAPSMISDDIADTMEAIDFQLDKGTPLGVRVVGPDKKPLEGAYISFWIWDEQEVYGSLPASHGKTDAKGEWVWENAPQGTLRFAVSLPGYHYLREVELSPGQENVVVMSSESMQTTQTIKRNTLEISGRVLDAETKQPILRFKTKAGYKREASGKTYWLQDTLAKGRDGVFRRIFTSNDLGSDMYALAVQVEADGYRPVVVERVIADKQTFKADVALEKAADNGFRVLMPNGEPASEATVAVCTPEVGPTVQDGRVISNSTCERTTTDATGRFSITPQKGLFSLLVLHGPGAALVTQHELAQSHTIFLQSWARVEGTLQMQGEPAANESITLNRAEGHFEMMPKIFYQYQTKTDQDGKFSFERVVPSEVYVARIAVSEVGGGMTSLIPTIVSDTIQLQPGETAQVELGRAGLQIAGKLVIPAEADKNVHWPLTMLNLQSRPKNAPDRPKIPFPALFNPEKDQKAARKWFEMWQSTEAGKLYQENIKKYSEAMNGFKPKYYHGRVETDGAFQFEDIPPGDYQLNVQAYKSSPKHVGMHGDVVGNLNYPFVVPESTDDTANDPVNLGELTLEMVGKR